MHPPADRPWVIAHRGASHAERENTLEAFRHAAAVGADAVELDVRRTIDNALIVHHDASLADGRAIVSLTRAELRSTAPWIPDFDDALDACRGMWVNVEVKNSPGDPDWDATDGVVAEVVTLLERSDQLNRVLLSSFNPATIQRSRHLCPSLPTGWLIDHGMSPESFIPVAAEAGHRTLHPPASSMTDPAAPGLIESAHEEGLLVIVWTVDQPDEIVRLAAAGVDGIITNVPEVALSALG